MPEPLQTLRAARGRSDRRAGERSSTKNSRDNIAHHYDLSNELFELFLDPTLSYSSALFPEHLLDGAARREDLEAAQHRKIDRLLDQAGVGEGTRLLEIGTGWGELAIRAARRGATVRTITLSVEQKGWPTSGSPRPGMTRPGRRSSCATTATSDAGERTTPWCRSR